jgi:hypothetical protein
MQLEPPSLGVPLYRRDWSALLFVLASMGCAWLWHKPTHLPEILVSCLVGGLAFWLALGPGLSRLRHHQSWFVRAIFLVVSVAGVFSVMEYVVPLLSSYAARIA